MEIIGLIVLAFAILGVALTVRERLTGRGAITDDRTVSGQTEADREAIRAQDATHRDTFSGHSS
ncbi:hypothetical protein [Tateyamaria sp.]|uniref:hypothetical protein n=1 Tax=Tateyamaria sp. TaxID=1929288 RepID=UPI00329D4EC8